jgi:hypothetical protein
MDGPAPSHEGAGPFHWIHQKSLFVVGILPPCCGVACRAEVVARLQQGIGDQQVHRELVLGIRGRFHRMSRANAPVSRLMSALRA